MFVSVALDFAAETLRIFLLSARRCVYAWLDKQGMY